MQFNHTTQSQGISNDSHSLPTALTILYSSGIKMPHKTTRKSFTAP